MGRAEQLHPNRFAFDPEYRARLIHGPRVFHLHKAGATWIEPVPVQEVFRGKTLWKGDVEVFDLHNHPKAKRCYGWTYGEPEEFIIILELPPVTDAKSAVKVGVSYQIKKLRKR